MDDLIPLSHLLPGQSAHIGGLVGQPEDVHRLKEMGLCEGTKVEMLQAGSPCIVQVSGSRLCFRHSEVVSVFVRAGGGK